MFKIVLSDVGLLTNSIPIIAEIIDEGIFKVDQNGISLVSPDRTMVAVVDFKILSSAFEEYDVKSEESLGLNLSNLVSVLKRIKSSDKLIMESDGKGNKLKIVIEGNGTRTFKIPLIDVKTEKPPLDQLNFGGTIELESGIVEEGISDAGVIGDAIILEAGPESFKMHAKGDISSSELEMKKGDQNLLKLQVDKSIKSQYPLEYLKKMIKASKLSKQLILEFGTDYPMRMSFKAIDKVHLSFVLAPRVMEE